MATPKIVLLSCSIRRDSKKASPCSAMATPIPNSIQSAVVALQTVAGGNRAARRRGHLTSGLERLPANAAPDVAATGWPAVPDLCTAALEVATEGDRELAGAGDALNGADQRVARETG